MTESDRKATIVVVEITVSIPLTTVSTVAGQMSDLRSTVNGIEDLVKDAGGSIFVQEAKFA